jgi:hypothetical protein
MRILLISLRKAFLLLLVKKAVDILLPLFLLALATALYIRGSYIAKNLGTRRACHAGSEAFSTADYREVTKTTT